MLRLVEQEWSSTKVEVDNRGSEQWQNFLRRARRAPFVNQEALTTQESGRTICRNALRVLCWRFPFDYNCDGCPAAIYCAFLLAIIKYIKGRCGLER